MTVVTKCRCGHKNTNGTCVNCSRYKMGIMLKNGCDDLKVTAPNGKKVNPYWYSPIKQNKRKADAVFESMYKRFTKSPLYRFTNVLVFYCNQTGQQLAKYTL